MGLYTHLYNQTATWKQVSGTNEYNESIYSSKSINCRIEYKNKLIVTANGQQKTSLGNLTCDEAVSINDIINTQGRDYTVIQSSPLVDFDGITQVFRCYF